MTKTGDAGENVFRVFAGGNSEARFCSSGPWFVCQRGKPRESTLATLAEDAGVKVQVFIGFLCIVL